MGIYLYMMKMIIVFFSLFFQFHFHNRGFARSLVFKARVSGTRKLTFASGDFQTESLLSGYRSTCILIQ